MISATDKIAKADLLWEKKYRSRANRAYWAFKACRRINSKVHACRCTRPHDHRQIAPTINSSTTHTIHTWHQQAMNIRSMRHPDGWTAGITYVLASSCMRCPQGAIRPDLHRTPASCVRRIEQEHGHGKAGRMTVVHGAQHRLASLFPTWWLTIIQWMEWWWAFWMDACGPGRRRLLLPCDAKKLEERL